MLNTISSYAASGPRAWLFVILVLFSLWSLLSFGWSLLGLRRVTSQSGRRGRNGGVTDQSIGMSRSAYLSIRAGIFALLAAVGMVALVFVY